MKLQQEAYFPFHSAHVMDLPNIGDQTDEEKRDIDFLPEGAVRLMPEPTPEHPMVWLMRRAYDSDDPYSTDWEFVWVASVLSTEEEVSA